MPWNPELTVRAKEFITSLDKSRGLNYQEYVPELGKILNADTN